MNKFSLKNKVIIVTGALGLLGRQHVEAICEAEGIPVLIDLNQKALDTYINEILKKYKIDASGYSVDITDEKQIIKSCDEIISKYKGIYPLILSEELFEPIFDLDLLSWNGKFLRGVVRRRVDPSDPNAGNIIVKNQKILDQGKKIAKLFNLSWLYDCDFMLDKKGNPVLIEMNPRMSGSASVSVAAGIPLFDDIISLARNKRIQKKVIPIGRKIIAFKSLKEFI